MGSVYGNKLKIAVFGESHGEGIGVVIDGFPAGFQIDYGYINDFLKRRSPGNILSSPRMETDKPEILSGVKDGFTTGAPICVFIKNDNANPAEYQNDLTVPRPNHADYNAYIKYNGYSDHRGGGHFSGRLTAPLVFAGALCAGWLEKEYDIKIKAYLKQAGSVVNNPQNEKIGEIEELILKLKKKGDSVGSIIECTAENVPQGLGDHMFSSVEAAISSCIFGIPGVKGIEFGKGFGFAVMKASKANDEYYYGKNGEVKTKTNNSGGINGGMSSGMPIVFSVVLKPAPSILSEQNSVNIKTKKNEKITIKGRHDPCIGLRAVPAVEAAAALAFINLIL